MTTLNEARGSAMPIDDFVCRQQQGSLLLKSTETIKEDTISDNRPKKLTMNLRTAPKWRNRINYENKRTTKSWRMDNHKTRGRKLRKQRSKNVRQKIGMSGLEDEAAEHQQGLSQIIR